MLISSDIRAPSNPNPEEHCERCIAVFLEWEPVVNLSTYLSKSSSEKYHVLCAIAQLMEDFPVDLIADEELFKLATQGQDAL